MRSAYRIGTSHHAYPVLSYPHLARDEVVVTVDQNPRFDFTLGDSCVRFDEPVAKKSIVTVQTHRSSRWK